VAGWAAAQVSKHTTAAQPTGHSARGGGTTACPNEAEGTPHTKRRRLAEASASNHTFSGTETRDDEEGGKCTDADEDEAAGLLEDNEEGARVAMKKEKLREGEAQRRHDAPVARAGPLGAEPGPEAVDDPDVKVKAEGARAPKQEQEQGGRQQSEKTGSGAHAAGPAAATHAHVKQGLERKHVNLGVKAECARAPQQEQQQEEARQRSETGCEVSSSSLVQGLSGLKAKVKVEPRGT
jgi:hypothetical protein